LCSHVHSSWSLPRRRRQSHPQPPLPRLHPRRETRHFWSATPSAPKAMFACRAQAALPGPLSAPAPKPPCLRMSSGSPSRSSPTSSAPMQTQPERSKPATPRGQRDVAEFPRHQQGLGSSNGTGGIDSCRLGSRELPKYWRDSLPLIAVNREPKGANGRSTTGRRQLHPTPEHQWRVCPHDRLHCGSDSAGAVHCRLLLLPPGRRISTSFPVDEDSGCARGVALTMIIFACTSTGRSWRRLRT